MLAFEFAQSARYIIPADSVEEAMEIVRTINDQIRDVYASVPQRILAVDVNLPTKPKADLLLSEASCTEVARQQGLPFRDGAANAVA